MQYRTIEINEGNKRLAALKERVKVTPAGASA